MALTVLLGGVRSGKSRLAVELARRSGAPVSFVATAEPRDAEMAERIRRHVDARPRAWRTIEEPLELLDALTSVPDDTCVVIDCLTLWVSNAIGRGSEDREIELRAREAAELAASRRGLTVVVSNEVGWGIVPANALARRYADVLGRVNGTWVRAAARSFLVVAGEVVQLAAVDDVLGPTP